MLADGTSCAFVRTSKSPEPHKPTHMRIQHHLSTALLVMLALPAAAQVISVHRNGQSFFHYDMGQFEELIETTSPDHTLPGDTVILPGGTITTGILTVNKPLTFIGAGCISTGTPVTSTTILRGEQLPNNNMVIQPGAAGTSFHGIYFDRTVIFSGPGLDVPGFSTRFERCRFSEALCLTSLGAPYFPSPSNITLIGCVLEGSVYAGPSMGPSNFTCSNSFLTGQLSMNGQASNTVFTQCCFFIPSFTNYTYPLSGISFTNNIFLRSGSSVIGFPNVNGTTFQNNLFSTGSGADPAFSFGANVGANSGNQSASSNIIFENVATFTGYNELYDYHLQAGSPAIAAGVFGYDLGVYDGPPGSAWKEGAIPFNPHWEQLSPLGTVSGGLAVFASFQASAQQDLGPAQLVGVRYWVGQPSTGADPEVRFKAVEPPQAQVELQDLALDVCGFASGNQVLKLQLLDSEGRWSSIVTRTMNVIPAGAPNAVQAITPSDQLCPGSTVTFTATHTTTAPNGTPTLFTWSVPAGYTIVSGQGTLSAQVTIGVNAGSFVVTASNYCGDAVANFPVSPIQPLALSAVFGADTVCVGSSSQLSTQALSGTYVWNSPQGWTFEPPNPSGSTATIVPGGTAVQGQLSVLVLNQCSVPSNTVYLELTPAQPADLGSIAGPTSVCLGVPAVFAVDDVAGTYVWSAPSGWTFDPPGPSGSQGTAVPGTDAEEGEISVYLVDAYCTSAPASLSVTPDTSAQITMNGPSNVYVYAAAAITATTSSNADFVWSLPTGWSWDPLDSDTTDGTAYVTAPSVPGPDTICVSSTSVTGCEDIECWVVTVDLNVGVPSQEDPGRLSVRPNPSNGLFVVDIDGVHPTALVLRDATGRTIWSMPNATDIRMIDLQGLPNGTYLLETQGADMPVLRERLVIQH